MNNTFVQQNIHVLRISKRIAPIPGGLEQHARELAESQSSIGSQNLLVFGRGAPPPDAQAAYLRLKDTNRLPGDFIKGSAFSALAALHPLLKAVPINVIHTHGSAGDMLAAMALRRPGRKLFHTFHGSLGMPGHVRAILRACLPQFDGIFVVSTYIEKQLRSLNCRLPKVHVFTSAVDNLFFRVRPVQTPRVALMVGRLAQVKGFETGLAAALQLLDRGLIDGVEIAGDGPDMEKLKEVAKDLRMPVRFHGRVEKDGLSELMSRAALVLVPSRTLPGQAEGSPTVILESWASGVPVVATRSGGIPYLVRDRINAVLADEGDAHGMAMAGEWALSHRRELIAAGKERARGCTWQALGRKVLDAYGI